MECTFILEDKVTSGECLPLGARVKRGENWKNGDQDGNGPGTVFNHDKG